MATSSSIAIALSVAVLAVAVGTTPGAAAPACCSPACFSNSTCQSNKENRIATVTAATAAECCAACSKNTECQTWTHYDGDKCNLFRTQKGYGPGRCTSGNGKIAPPGPPPPAPTPPNPPQPGPACKDCPNIILFLTDDQDLLIGGWEPSQGVMAKTEREFAQQGMTATHWYIHTAICAPSRSELQSGRYFRNIKNDVPTPSTKVTSGAVGHIDLGNKVWPYTFMQQLREQKGYTTGLFGKCMNGGCGGGAEAAGRNLHQMGAFDVWFEGTGYQNGEFYDNQAPGCAWPWDSGACATKLNASDPKGNGYLTSSLGNRTVDWIREVRASADQRPFFAYYATHAPHSPATPAAWYADACPGTKSPRLPNWNYSGVEHSGSCVPNTPSANATSDFHELVSCQPYFDDKDVKAIDGLARKRCQTLLSIDDTYSGVLAAVRELGIENNTYFLITSDHGYNLGHHMLPSNKFLTYDHSSRIPMVFKGPGIAPGSTTDFLGTQVDLGPTILGLAGIDTPATMDGKSLVRLLVDEGREKEAPASVRTHLARYPAVPDRTHNLFTYYNQGPWFVGSRHPLDDWSNTYIGGLFRNTSDGGGPYKYAEYDPTGKQTDFASVRLHELFDLSKDPYELHNIYPSASPALRAELHTKLHAFYLCQGATCP